MSMTCSACGEGHAAILENAAVRNVRRGTDAMARGDIDEIATMAAPGFSFEDRRKGLTVDFVGEAPLREQTSMMAGNDFDVEVVAVRGDHLALMRVTERSAEGYFGGSLNLNQVDDDGIGIANVVFDEDDLGAAIDELDRRYAAMLDIPPVRNFRRTLVAMKTNSIGDVASLAAPGFVTTDRRRGLQVEFTGVDDLAGYTEGFSDATFELEVIAVRGSKLALLRSTSQEQHGYLHAGINVRETNDDGLTVASVVFDDDDLASAVEEFERRASTSE